MKPEYLEIHAPVADKLMGIAGADAGGRSTVRERVAFALALEYYRGEYRVRCDWQPWLDTYTSGMKVGTVIAAQYAEERAQESALLFWSHWQKDADALNLSGL